MAAAPSSVSASSLSFSGKCSCGKVELQLHPEAGQDVKSAFCHCYSCQRLAMAPVTWDLMLHDAEPGRGFKLTGALLEDERTLPTHRTVRIRCAGCHCPVAAKWKLNDAATWGWSFPCLLFVLAEGQGLPEGFPKPTHHCWYKNRTVDFKDGLPKWESWPTWSQEIPE